MDLDDLLEDELGLHDEDADLFEGSSIIYSLSAPPPDGPNPTLQSAELTASLWRIAEEQYTAGAAKRPLAELDANAQQLQPEHGAYPASAVCLRVSCTNATTCADNHVPDS